MSIKYYLNKLFRVLGSRRQPPNEPKSESSAFLVYNPEWPDPPRFWFDNIVQAKTVAENLAKKQPQNSFYVMKAVLVVSAKPETRELASGEA